MIKMYIYDKGLLTSFRQKVHVYKQFSEMYISTLLGSPKLPSFILPPFSWLSKSKRNIKTLLLMAMHLSAFYSYSRSHTKPNWERANKTTNKFHPETDGQSSFFFVHCHPSSQVCVSSKVSQLLLSMINSSEPRTATNHNLPLPAAR